MFPILLFFSFLVVLSNALLIPISPEVQSATNNKTPAPPLPSIKAAPPIFNPAPSSSSSNTLILPPISATNKTTPLPNPASALPPWPALPFTYTIGNHLTLTITTLGPFTSPMRRNEILNAITDLHYLIATEGDPYEPIRGVYARSSGIVWTVVGCSRSEVAGAMKRFQIAQVLGAVWSLMEDYGPREVVRSEIVQSGGQGVASFVLRFFGQVGG